MTKIMQHRVFKAEIHDEEKIDLNEYKIRKLAIVRSAYVKHSLELIKFYYCNGEQKSYIEIDLDTFRFKDEDGNKVIKPFPKRKSLYIPQNNEESIIPTANVEILELPSRSESELDVKDIVAKLEAKSKV